MSFDTFVYLLEIFSITVFAISSSLVACESKLDAFGVICTGVIGCLGGGFIRDMLIGLNPPMSFSRPLYALTACVFSLLTFVVEYVRVKRHNAKHPLVDTTRNWFMFAVDTLGLGTFTAVGVAVAFEYATGCNNFVVIVAGVLTGVGGGVLRDVLVGRKPYIFIKHFYACASIIGAMVTTYTWDVLGKVTSMIIGALTVMILRILARVYEWNFPTIPYPAPDSKEKD